MRRTATTNILLLAIAIALIVIAAKPFLTPRAAQAQTSAPYAVYIEPGTQSLKSPDGTQQVYGRMIVDLQTGNVWGFPTITTAPYPQDISSTKAPVSHPFLLGKFAFADMEK